MFYDAYKKIYCSFCNLIFKVLTTSPVSATQLIYKVTSKSNESWLSQHLLLNQLKGPFFTQIQEVKYSFLANDSIDGMLLYLFAKAGFVSRVAVDIGAGNCINANTANLILFHQFQGFMIDGSKEALKIGESVYKGIGHGKLPIFIPSMLTTSNINDILENNGVPENVDLLSIDIDSIDVYIAEKIKIKARVVVVEFNNLWGPTESFSVPNKENFQRELGEFLYGGASLSAFQRVLGVKGYKLVGVAASEFDAFFVLDNSDFADVPTVSIESLYLQSPKWQNTFAKSINHSIRTKEWVKI